MPALHARQAPLDVAPINDEYVPGAHDWQMSLVLDHVPGLHGVQRVLPSGRVPAPQGWQLADAVAPETVEYM